MRHLQFPSVIFWTLTIGPRPRTLCYQHCTSSFVLYWENTGQGFFLFSWQVYKPNRPVLFSHITRRLSLSSSCIMCSRGHYYIKSPWWDKEHLLEATTVSCGLSLLSASTQKELSCDEIWGTPWTSSCTIHVSLWLQVTGFELWIAKSNQCKYSGSFVMQRKRGKS